MAEPLEYPTGKCNCLTKTPDPVHHEHTCPVWLYYHAMSLQTKLDQALAEGAGGNEFVARPQLSLADCYDVIDGLRGAIQKRLQRHGYGVAAGPHEILGILDEEMDELRDEVRANNHEKFYDELVDIAIAAIFGMASMVERAKFERKKKSALFIEEQ